PQDELPVFILQLHITLPHFLYEVQNYLNNTLPYQCIGCSAGRDTELLLWSPQSQIFWGVEWDVCASIPTTFTGLKVRIMGAVDGINRDML
ncbi:hypothetical protein AVEN_24647-1, partial [Araneus ventricosus]